MFINNNFGVNFNGRRIVHPGAYDAINAEAMTVMSSGSMAMPVVVGNADAGEPGVLKWFPSSSSARSYLKGGEALTAVEMMFSPIPEGGGGASVVGVIVANPNTKATAVIGGITFTSLLYGKDGNKIQAKIEAGTLSESKKLTIYDWDSGITEVYDNTGTVLRIKYVGAGTAVTVAITDNILTTKVDAATDLTINLLDERYDTVGKLVSHIASIADYECTLINQETSRLSSSKLDTQTDTSILGQGLVLKSLKGDLEYQVNGSSQLVSIVVSGTPTVAVYTYLQGGTTGISPVSWAAHFNKLKSHFSNMLVVLSADVAIHAEAITHIAEMEARGQKQTMYTGGNIGETKEQTMERARALNQSRAILAYPGISHKLVGGGKEKLPAYMTAALIAGRVAGVDPSEPITFDYLDVVGLNEDLVAGDPDIDQLLLAGVCTLERVQNGGVRVVQGITTYTGSNNIVYREISGRRGADSLSENVRRKLEDTFVGKKGLRPTTTSVQTVTLDELEKALVNGDITAYDPKSITVRFDNTGVYVDFMAAPVEPINYVLLTSRFVPDQSL